MSAAEQTSIVPIQMFAVEGGQQIQRTPMDMLHMAVARGDTQLAEKLMDLSERWEKNQARRAFDAAIAAAKGEIKPVTRNKTGHNSKAYADFSAIAKAVDPILAKHGLSYRFRTTQTDRISVTCVLAHCDGHAEETTLSGPPDASGSKNAIQAIGSTLSYLQRYSLVQMLGLAAADDDDGKSMGSGAAITDEQADTLQKLIVATKSDIGKFCTLFKVESVADLAAKDYDRAIALLNKKAGV
jgi:hypothetical protein